jgi:2-keto-4-pentenoate hydratase/2-oxohepta-3-ene-1,7-dioic acid hydratase in catechol pathway
MVARRIWFALKLVHYVKSSIMKVGIVENGQIFDLTEIARRLNLKQLKGIESIDQLLSAGALDRLGEVQGQISVMTSEVLIESVELRSPILYPEKILLVARNYLSHNVEQNSKPPSEPYFFTKFKNALIGPNEPILIPKISTQTDWEAELAVIIGKAGKNIQRKDAMEYVAGYAVSNDVSFRDLQFSTRADNAAVGLGSNWVKGKGLDSSFPLGPCLVTREEIMDPHSLDISLTVNGELRQQSNTREMIFKVDSLIEYVSAGMTLRPGDVISTGTPQGVAVFTGQQFLNPGDVVEARISGIGSLRNPVRLEQ